MTDVLQKFADKKEADSQFLSLPDDGDSAVITKVVSIEMIEKLDFNKVMTDTLRLTVEVETSEGTRVKLFDQTSKRFADSLIAKGIKEGMGFKIIRDGLGAETRYIITDVKVAEEKAEEPKSDEIDISDIPFA